MLQLCRGLKGLRLLCFFWSCKKSVSLFLFRCVTHLVSLNIHCTPEENNDDPDPKPKPNPDPKPDEGELDVHNEVLQHIRDTKISLGMRALSVLR